MASRNRRGFWGNGSSSMSVVDKNALYPLLSYWRSIGRCEPEGRWNAHTLGVAAIDKISWDPCHVRQVDSGQPNCTASSRFELRKACYHDLRFVSPYL